ncbi:MAG: C10 family peptidase [Bacteroidales bacterium]|nr:C10 family peptidase [Bacteroidales bacterium]
MNYAVTKEMIIEFLKIEQSEKPIISVKGYPSEDAPSLFLVNYEEGWKLFPSDSRFGVIMAESPVGHIDLWEETDNLGYELWMESLQEQIEYSRKISMEHYNEQSVKFWRTLEAKSSHRFQSPLSKKNVEQNRGLWVVLEVGRSLRDSTIVNRPHLVPSMWGQNYPWNIKMPVVGTDTCKVGCAAVAVAQVLFYFNTWYSSPTGLYHQINEISRSYDYLAQGYSLTLNRSDYVSNSTRWNEMPWSKESGNTTQFGYSSDLMLDIGVRLGMRYNTNSSGVSVVGGTNFFNLSPANISFSWAPYNYSTVDTVINNLIARKPVIMTATRGDSSYSRHTWVVDGFWEREMYTLVQYELWPVSMLSEIYDDSYGIVAMMNESEMAATYPGYYAGMSFSRKEDTWNLLQLYMNWGDDGERQWELYYPYPETSWEGYSVTKSIHYNLVPGELNM